MDFKTITVSVTGQAEYARPSHQPAGEYRRECDFFTVDLKSGQAFKDRYQNSLPIGETSMLVAVSESCLGARAQTSARCVPLEVMAKWLIKVSKRLTPPERLMRGIEEANYHVWRSANEDHETQLISASMAVALVEENIAYVAQVGSAGAFIMRNGRIRRLPDPQSIQFITAEDSLDEESEPPIWLTLELGSNKFIQTGITAIELQANDQLLLCTENIIENLRLADIIQIAVRNITVAAACPQMLATARQQGSERACSLALMQFSGDGLMIQPGATQLTNSFRFFARAEPTATAKLQTMEFSSFKTDQIPNEELPDANLATRDEGIHRNTIGIAVTDERIGHYAHQEQINDGFVNCSAQLVQAESLIQTQITMIKSMIEWVQSQGMMDGHLFASYLKLEIALKKAVEARAIIDEAENEFPFSQE
jgi:PPM family protein phosphatase